MDLKVELLLKQVGNCYIKTEYLDSFIESLQNGGFLVSISAMDGEIVDVENVLCDEEYIVSVLKCNPYYK